MNLKQVTVLQRLPVTGTSPASGSASRIFRRITKRSEEEFIYFDGINIIRGKIENFHRRTGVTNLPPLTIKGSVAQSPGESGEI